MAAAAATTRQRGALGLPLCCCLQQGTDRSQWYFSGSNLRETPRACPTLFPTHEQVPSAEGCLQSPCFSSDSPKCLSQLEKTPARKSASQGGRRNLKGRMNKSNISDLLPLILRQWDCSNVNWGTVSQLSCASADFKAVVFMDGVKP